MGTITVSATARRRVQACPVDGQQAVSNIKESSLLAKPEIVIRLE
ncbi:MAG: hypothetical protein ACK46A_02845 [Akkermansiaceae bacterium]|jgi:hypothetical protein